MVHSQCELCIGSDAMSSGQKLVGDCIAIGLFDAISTSADKSIFICDISASCAESGETNRAFVYEHALLYGLLCYNSVFGALAGTLGVKGISGLSQFLCPVSKGGTRQGISLGER